MTWMLFPCLSQLWGLTFNILLFSAVCISLWLRSLYTVKRNFLKPQNTEPPQNKNPAKRQVAWRKPDPSTERELISPSSGYYHRDSDWWLKVTSVIYNKISKQRAKSADELAQILRSLWLVGEGEMREEKERYLQISALLWYSSPSVLPSKLQLLELLLPSIEMLPFPSQTASQPLLLPTAWERKSNFQVANCHLQWQEPLVQGFHSRTAVLHPSLCHSTWYCL